MLQKFEKQPAIPLTRGKYILANEPPSNQDLLSMSPDEKKKVEESLQLSKPKNIPKRDLKKIKSLNFRPSDPKLQNSSEEPKLSSENGDGDRSWSIYLGLGASEYDHSLYQNHKVYTTSSTPGLGFGWKYSSWFSLGLHLHRVDFQQEEWLVSTGANEMSVDDFSNNATRFDFIFSKKWKSLNFRFLLSLLFGSEFVASYKFIDTQNNSTFWVETKYSMSGSLRPAVKVEWQFLSHYNVFFEYGVSIFDREIQQSWDQLAYEKLDLKYIYLYDKPSSKVLESGYFFGFSWDVY